LTAFRCRRALEIAVVVLALTSAAFVTGSTSAGASSRSSLLCSGYQGCSHGAYTTNGYQRNAGRSFWTMYPGNNCTNYVAYVESTIYGVPTPTYNLGDGGVWGQAAARHGVRVNGVPTVGAVAVWVGGSSGIPWPGHVAVVEDIGPHGRYIDISQQHMSSDADGYDWTRIYRDASDNEWQDWPTSFIHFRGGPGSLVDGVHVGLSVSPPNAFDTAGGWLDTFGIRGHHLHASGIDSSTSPSISAVPRGFEVAFETSRQHLATAGVDGERRYRVVVKDGTSPTITAVLRGYEIAVQSNKGRLVTIGPTGTHVWKLRMKSHTSPSITPLFGGGYEVAVESRTGSLVTLGTDGIRNWGLGMKSGTSPSITATFDGGYEVALQTSGGKLLTVGSSGTRYWDLKLRAHTSPSITAAFDGGYEVACETPTGHLVTVGALGDRIWAFRARAGTSPSITARHGGGFEVAFQSNSGTLVTVSSSSVRIWSIRMAPDTSPSIRP
jgi:surface antigen/predicted secreted protein